MRRIARTLAIGALGACCSSVAAQPASQDRLIVPSLSESEDHFGQSVDLSGDRLLVGAWGEDVAYIYRVSDGVEVHILEPPQNGRGFFGRSVAISGSRCIVGTPGENQLGDGSGAAYIFNTNNGARRAKLVASDGGTNQGFGRSVGISGNLAVVGASQAFVDGVSTGAAYVFDVENEVELLKLSVEGLDEFARFGGSVAIDGNLVVVGAEGQGSLAEDAGAAFVFDATTGDLLHTLLPSSATFEEFGTSVDIRDGVIIVGARRTFDPSIGATCGSAYVFDAQTGQLLHQLFPQDPEPAQGTGLDVAISPPYALVGAPSRDNGEEHDNRGSAYIFEIETGRQLKELRPDLSFRFDRFANAVALDGDVAACGNRNMSLNPGQVVLFSPTCASDCDLDGNITFNDLVLMLFEFGPVHLVEACDADGSGAVDFDDLVATLFLFGPCP